MQVREHSTGEISQVHDFETVATWINGIWKKKDLEIRAIRQSLCRD
jgi:hypothetical protein